MRLLFALLLCFVLMQTECFALRGGPVFATASVPIGGTYSGVLVPDLIASTGTSTITSDAENSLGLFTLAVPATGIATGAAFIFSAGRSFTGVINAFADPDSGRISGIIQTQFAFNLQRTTVNPTSGAVTVTSIPITATANGQLKANIVSAPTAFSVSLARLTGTAKLDISGGFVSGTSGVPIITETVTFLVEGAKQSSAVVTTTITPQTQTGG
jgi:hypothetical protein